MKNKKILLSIISVMLLCVCMLFSSCGRNNKIMISSDYSTITYNSKNYKLTDKSIGMFDDCEEYDASVEGKSVFYYLDFMCYDKVYISNDDNRYIWLSSTTDETNNELFNILSKNGGKLTYKITEN